MNYSTFTSYAKKDSVQIGLDKIYRAFSYPISFVLYKIGCTPNFVSVLSITLSLFGGMLLIMHYFLLGIGIFILSYVFDFCDGNIARVIRKSTTNSSKNNMGELLETLNTNVSLLSFFGALSYYLFIEYELIFVLMFGFIVFGLKMLVRYTKLHQTLLAQVDKEYTPIHVVSENSILAPLKVFLTKGIFNFNFYYILFFVVGIFFEAHTLMFFYAYLGFDGLYSAIRLIRSFV